MENNQTSNQMALFVKWASTAKKADGSFYSKRSIKHYKDALIRGILDFPCDITPRNNFFQITESDEMIAIRDKLYENADFSEFCRSGKGITGNNDLTAAMTLYIKFLLRDKNVGGVREDEIFETPLEDEGLKVAPRWEKVPKPKIQQNIKTNTVYFNRDKKTYQNALAKAGHKCELCHQDTFVSKATGLQYVEGHHLVPLSEHYFFPYSLDIEENIVCLCPNCHRKLHHGVDVKEDLKRLFDSRKKDLSRRGINLSLDDLLSYYNIN